MPRGGKREGAGRKAKGAAATDNRVAKQLEPFHFKAGQSGNPKGRPKGSRNKISEDMLADLHEAWKAKGKVVIDEVIATRPHEFLKVMASILPKEVNVNTNAFEDMSEDELAAGIAALQSFLAAQGNAEGSEAETRH